MLQSVSACGRLGLRPSSALLQPLTFNSFNTFNPLNSFNAPITFNTFSARPPVRLMSSQPVRRDREGNVVKRNPKKWLQQQKIAKRENVIARESKRVALPDISTPKSLAGDLGVRAVDVLKLMIKMGEKPRTSDDPIRYDLAALIAVELNYEPIPKSETMDRSPSKLPADISDLPKRPPIVTVIGHIDHGKTTLLDALRDSNVVEKEAGRITQHIGAFTVEIENEDPDAESGIITFMDTPGHEAFTSLRERGVATTDIALLVVAADDGVQEQTIEAIRVAKEANVQIIVCITKIDKVSDGDTQADTTHIREQLFSRGIEIEGTRPGHAGVPCVEVSAKTGAGLEDLKAAILIQAELMNLRAPTTGDAEGYVLESRLEKGRGPLATVLVTFGTMTEGDFVVIGLTSGRIKFMKDHNGESIKTAVPGIPVEILGLKEVPAPGEYVFCFSTKEEAEQVSEYRQSKVRLNSTATEREETAREEEMARAEAVAALTAETGRSQFDKTTIQNKVAQLQKLKEAEQQTSISVILKTDVAGSAEGVQKALSVLPQDEIKLNIVRSAVGPIAENDVTAAKLANACIVGFNIKSPAVIYEIARKRGVTIIEHRVVYNIVNTIRDLMSALLPPNVVTDVVGEAHVKEMFEVNKGTKSQMTVAGCIVDDGMMKRGANVLILRGGEVILESKLDTLRLFKNPVTEVKKGSDCGITLAEFNEFQPGDIIRCIAKRNVPRKLGDKKMVPPYSRLLFNL